MCLISKKAESEKKEWLENKPKELICYKVALKEDGFYFPPFYSDGAYEKVNKLPYMRGYTHAFTKDGGFKYKPYYHLYYTKQAAFKTIERWQMECGRADGCSVVVLRCRVPKKHIIEIGEQLVQDHRPPYRNYYYRTIVSTKFEIIEEVTRCA